MASLFDLDDNLEQSGAKRFEKELRKAKLHILREELDKALAIYEAILEEDMEVEEAYIGLLRVHSNDYTVYEGEQIEKDIRIITKMFDDIDDEELIDYLSKRKRYFRDKEDEASRKEAELARKKDEEERKQAARQIEKEKKENELIGLYGFVADKKKTTLGICEVHDNLGEGVDEVTIPYWVKKFVFDDLGEMMWYGEELKFHTLNFENGCKVISAELRGGSYRGLTEIHLPNTLETIEQNGFADLVDIKNLDIPKSVTSIGIAAFYNCKSLKTITIPYGITLIEDSTFAGCSSLSSITIPSSVSSLGFSAFDDCPKLKNINFKGTKKQWESIDGKRNAFGYKAEIKVSCTDGELIYE